MNKRAGYLLCFVAAASLVTCQRFTESQLKEASMNFDLKDVQPFISRLNGKFALLSFQDTDHVAREIEALPVKQTGQWNFQVNYQSQAVPLRIQALKDDVDAVDIYFFTAPTLAATIQTEMKAFAKENGK
jgi:hypothetical protein